MIKNEPVGPHHDGRQTPIWDTPLNAALDVGGPTVTVEDPPDERAASLPTACLPPTRDRFAVRVRSERRMFPIAAAGRRDRSARRLAIRIDSRRKQSAPSSPRLRARPKAFRRATQSSSGRCVPARAATRPPGNALRDRAKWPASCLARRCLWRRDRGRTACRDDRPGSWCRSSRMPLSHSQSPALRR